jgi:hypothetical protein
VSRGKCFLASQTLLQSSLAGKRSPISMLPLAPPQGARPRCLTSAAKPRMDSCVITRPSRWAGQGKMPAHIAAR